MLDITRKAVRKPTATTVDLSKFSDQKLQQFTKDIGDIEVELERRKTEGRDKVLAKMKQLAASIEMTPEEVLGYGVERKTKKKVPAAPKYRNPKNSEETWSGRGPRPNWLKEALGSGMTLEEMEIR